MEETLKSFITKAQHQEIIDFANKLAAKRKALWLKRGKMNNGKPSDEPKIGKDTIGGIILEQAVCNYFTEYGRHCTRPDLRVYEKGNSFFKHDMVLDKKFMLHIKSFLECTNFTKSGVFEKSDPAARFNDGGYYILGEVHCNWTTLLTAQPKINVTIHCFTKMKTIHEQKLFRPMDNGSQTKICVPLSLVQALPATDRWSDLYQELYGL